MVWDEAGPDPKDHYGPGLGIWVLSNQYIFSKIFLSWLMCLVVVQAINIYLISYKKHPYVLGSINMPISQVRKTRLRDD